MQACAYRKEYWAKVKAKNAIVDSPEENEALLGRSNTKKFE